MIARVKAEDAYVGGQLGSKAGVCPMSLGGHGGDVEEPRSMYDLNHPMSGPWVWKELGFGFKFYLKSFPTHIVMNL